MALLTQNKELRDDDIWNWTLPAWHAVLPTSGRHINVCPNAGVCIKVCYARNGAYNFPSVKAAHAKHLEMVVEDLNGWMNAMMTELSHKKFRPKPHKPRLPDMPKGHLSPEVRKLLDSGAACVRIHDSGDFLSDEYLIAWVTIASMVPDVLFYAYTKEVERFYRICENNPEMPRNFLWCYSLGGRQDHLIDLEHDYHADVFPDAAAIEAAGYYNQDEYDLLCVVAPSHRIGVPQNNIAAFKKRLAGRTFGELEQEQRDQRSILREQRRAVTVTPVPLDPFPDPNRPA